MIEPLESRWLMAAAPPTLLRDPSPAGFFVEAGDRAFFTESATNLYVSNGTAAGTFLLRGFGKVGGMVGVGGDAYLTTDTGVWRSDGTPAGTVHVLPMYNNIDGMARASGFTEMGGKVYFHAEVRNGGEWQRGLWKTDGTAGGTSFIAPVFAENLTVVGNTLYFVGKDNVSEAFGKELWKTDGTTAGTAMVKDIYAGASSGMDFATFERAIAAVGDRLVFKARDGASANYNLWSTNGTEAGTTQLGSVVPLQDFTTIGGAVFFGAQGAAGTSELWKSDGTALGTTPIKDLASMSPSVLLDAQGTLYFAGRDGTNSASLWKSDGTATGTVPVAGPAQGQPFGNIANLTHADGTVVFTASDPAVISGAYSLWTSDGTTAGTLKVRDTFTGGMQGAPGNVGVAGSVALFTANDGVGAPELWAVQTATPLPVPEARARGPYEYVVAEGSTLDLHGYTTAEPLPGRPLTYAWDLDDDGIFGETGAGAIHGDETGTDPTFNAVGLDGPSTHVVRFRISDPTGYASTDSTNVAIRNGPPTLNVTGGPAVLTEGNAYTLLLSTSDGGPDTISQWTVDWGDGVTQTLPGNTNSVTHDYPDGPGTYGITVVAQDDDGEYRADVAAALDAGFGSGGVVTSNVVDREDTPRGVAVQPDGKIVTVSTLQLSATSGNTAIAINRYNPDGTLDATFGVGGRVQFQNGPGIFAGAVALQADGRILIGGSNVLIRLLPDGSLDPTFGPDQMGTTGEFGHVVAGIEVAADGDILVAGGGSTLVVGRFNPDGTLDADFGSGGRVITDVAANGGGVRDMTLQSDGKLLVVPYGYPPTPSFLVMRFNADGSPDSTFDGDGRATVEFESGTGVATSLALAADGTMHVAGYAPALPSSPQPGGNDAVVARLTATGALDTNFADGGRLRTVPAGPFNSSEPLQGMALPIIRALPDGRFLLGGSHQLFLNRWQYLVDRYHADGTADTSFAPGGRFAVDLGGTGIDALLRDMVVQQDGAPILYGGAGTAHNPSEALVRLTPTGLSVRVIDAGTPEVSVSAPPTTPEAATYTLGLSATDPDGDGITQWIINWGDGAVQIVDGNPSSVTHVYADGPRAVVIKASAIDGDRSISSVSANVTVTNVPPTISVSGGPSVAEGSPYTVQFGATDPGTDTITQWSINWGDGTSTPLPATATSAQHTYMDDGEYAVVVSATDEDGTFAAAPVNATITNVSPTLDPLGDRRAAAGANFQLTFTARDVVPEVFSGTIDWGDGSATTTFAGSATTPLAVNNFAVDHAYAVGGTYVVTINLSDGDGGTATGTAGVRVGDIVVRAFEDMNGNGVRESGDPARVGTTAFLDLDRDGTLDGGEPTATTDAFGDALFDGLSAGTRAARVVVPPNWHLSTPAAGFIDATPGTASALATFGLSQAAAATGTSYNDANANGVRDAGEGPFVGTLRARRVDTGAAVTVSTNAQGVYRFVGLLPGQYVVELTSTTRVTTAPQGRRGHLITVTGAEPEFAGLDIGSFAGTGGTVSGALYRDLNGNGSRDANEPGVFNQTVFIDANGNGMRDANELTALTNSSGAWSISRLPAGTYRFRQVLPPGSPNANDPAFWRDVTVSLGQTISDVNLARPYEQTYYVRRTGTTVLVYNGSEAGQFIVASAPASSTTPLVLSTSASDDWVTVDWALAVPVPTGGLHLDGLAGTGDTLSVIGTTAADVVTFAPGQITVNGTTFTHANFERITYDGNGGADNVTITGGPPVTLAGAQEVAPRVTEVFASSTAWTSGYLSYLDSSGQGDASYGYRLSASSHADELPWVNLNKISVRFSEHVTLATAAALRVIGVNTASYAGAFSYDPITFTATWQLASGSFTADKLLFLIDDALVSDGGGNALDGEWTNPTPPAAGAADTFPSGDGTPGGDFNFRLNVLPGDVNRNGIVQSNDALPIQASLLAVPGSAGYTIFKDVNGNGILQANDFLNVQSRLLNTLPAGEPVPPPAVTGRGRKTSQSPPVGKLFSTSTDTPKAMRLLEMDGEDLLADIRPIATAND